MRQGKDIGDRTSGHRRLEKWSQETGRGHKRQEDVIGDRTSGHRRQKL